MSSARLSPKVRRIVLTMGVTICTVTGSLYGAGLRMNMDAKKEAERQQAATPAEKIQALEAAREQLVAQRSTLERQIADLKQRQESRRREREMGIGGGNGGGGREG
ncbi:hypothetical protein AJ79_05274 [Helicocarpus griseus UAMH5409]|uniref:Uncharacterized protein n=1 Tax=Helicocarpus griseus UAMH5409 TaxID=1447875 RepID=A0A2B7XPU0_9EURO|nr:hypothetical protein AJ79_05274 [Helicocarpus griseus UAMH5409]